MRDTQHYLAAPVTLAAVALICLVFVGQLLSGRWYADVTNLQHALSFSLADVARGQWWRLVTPNLTNGPTPPDIGPPGFSHLFGNAVNLLVVGPAVERGLGRARYVLLLVIGGTVAYGWLVIPTPGEFFPDGTSGAAYAVGGALLALVILHPPKRRLTWLGLAVVAVGGLLGFVHKPLITVEIHSGGAVAGLLLGVFFERQRHTRTVVVAASLMVLSLIAVVALRSNQLGATDPRVDRSVAVGELPHLTSIAKDQPIVILARSPALVSPGRWRTTLAAAPDAMELAAGAIWLTTEDGSLRAFTRTGREFARLEIGPKPHAMAFDGRALWIASRHDLRRVDPTSRRTTDVIRTGASAHSARVVGDAVCLSDVDHPSIVCVDVRTHRLRRISVGGRSWALAADVRNALFVSAERQLVRVDVRTGRVERRRVAVPGSPWDNLELDRRGRIWAADYLDRRLIAISPSSGRIIDVVRLGLASPAGVAIDGDKLWVSVFLGGRLLRVALGPRR